MSSQKTATSQRNNSNERCTSEGGGRDKLKKVDGDFPTCMRKHRDSNGDETRKSEYLKGKGGGRLKHRTIDGDVPLCLRKTEKESNDDSSSKGKKREENESGSSTLSKTKHRDMNKMASGSKDMFICSTGKRNDDTKNKEVTFIILQKNMRSMHSSEKIEEMVSELEGYRWEAILLSETRRHEQAENMGDTSQTHFHEIWKIRQQTRSRNYVEQKVEAKNHRHRILQRACHHHHDLG